MGHSVGDDKKPVQEERQTQIPSGMTTRKAGARTTTKAAGYEAAATEFS
jgi:hypothetical protein